MTVLAWVSSTSSFAWQSNILMFLRRTRFAKAELMRVFAYTVRSNQAEIRIILSTQFL